MVDMHGIRPTHFLCTLVISLLISLSTKGTAQDATPEAPVPDQTKLGTEMLKNGSFDTFVINDEEVFKGSPSNWRAAPAALVTADYFDPERLCVVELSPDEQKYVNLEQEVTLPNTPAQIAISVDVLCEDVGKVVLTLIAVLDDGGQKRLVSVNNKLSRQWETLAATIDLPADFSAKKLVFRVSQRPGASQPSLIDNASMRSE